jgi:phosphatidylinositol-3-phosphatase
MRFFALSLVLVSSVSWTQVPQSRHVWIVTEENHSYETVIGNPGMPYFNSLVSRYGLAAQYYAEQHNSISALMWLIAGQPITGNNQTTTCYSVDNIARHLIAARLSWRSYQEDLPYPGFTGVSNLKYVRRHNPIIDFSDTCSANQAINSVPFSHLAADIANHRTPNYAYITPNLLNDAHDGSLAAADDWLSQHIPAILALPEFQPGGDGIMFIVWDEADLSSKGLTEDNRCSSRIARGCGGRLATLVIGPQVKRAYKSPMRYDHANLLRTICDAFGFSSCPGAAAVASPMADFFNTVTITEPFANAKVASPVQFQASASNASPVSSMQLYVDHVLQYRTSSNSFKVRVPMSLGTHYVVAQSWDSKGGIHKRGMYVSVQRQAVVVSNPPPNATVRSSVPLSAMASGASPITHMSVYVDGISKYLSTGNTLNTSLSLPKGKHTIVVQASDASGKLGSSSFSVTTAAPDIKIASPPSGLVSYGPTLVSADTVDPTPVQAVRIYVDSSLVYEVSGTGVRATVSIPNGTHSLTVQARNLSGATYKESVTVKVIPVPITFATPKANATVSSPVSVAAAAAASSPVRTMQLYVDSVLVRKTSGTSIKASLLLKSGQHYITAKGWDDSGHNWSSGEYINVR